VTNADDQSLLRDLRAGCPKACAELVRAHYQAVYRFLVHLTRNIHQAEDLTQETFAAAWEKLATFEGRATLATWLHRIAYTKFLDAQRADRRAAQMRERCIPRGIAPPDPLDGAMAEDEAECLNRALDELNASERTLLVLHYFQGLSYSDMASVLDEPSGTVKWRTSEALHHLRDMLSDEVPNHATRTTSAPRVVP
jgi:RNA polymerase sigma-70 factor (ECF subfamily)